MVCSLSCLDIAGVMRLRCSKGVTINGTNVYGNFHIRSTDLLALPCVDQSQAYTFQLKVEENLNMVRRVSFQVALLYTVCCGRLLFALLVWLGVFVASV